MSKPQVNLLLSKQAHDVLSALAFLNEEAATDVVRPIVEAFLQTQAKSPEVRAALQALEARRAKKEGKVTDLKQRGKGRSQPL